MEAPIESKEQVQGPRTQWFARLGFCLIAALLLLLVTFWWAYAPDSRNRSTNLIRSSHSPALSLPEPLVLDRELSAEELAFGAEQVERMVKDRPKMGRSVFKTDTLWQFCARGFGGGAIGETVLWNSALPEEKGYECDNSGPLEGRKAFIRIRKIHDYAETRGQHLSCEELWSCAVFELENLRNHPAFYALYKLALTGQLTREDWVRENSKLEYSAYRRTAEHYRELWCPLAKTRQLPETPELWGADTPPTYEAWILQYTDPNGYPWDAFARYYDQQIVPYLKSIHREVQVNRR